MAELKSRLDAIAIKKIDQINEVRKQKLKDKKRELRGVSNLSQDKQKVIFNAIRTKPLNEVSEIIKNLKGEDLALNPVRINRGELISKLVEFVICTENPSPLHLQFLDWLTKGDLQEAQGKKRSKWSGK